MRNKAEQKTSFRKEVRNALYYKDTKKFPFHQLFFLSTIFPASYLEFRWISSIGYVEIAYLSIKKPVENRTGLIICFVCLVTYFRTG
jgi:hypothetical protein